MSQNSVNPWEDAAFLSTHENLGRFFGFNFCADWLNNQSSLEEAVEDHIGMGDRIAVLNNLLSEVDDVRNRNFSEKQLAYLIDHHWDTAGDSGEPWGSYRTVLDELSKLLRAMQLSQPEK